MLPRLFWQASNCSKRPWNGRYPDFYWLRFLPLYLGMLAHLGCIVLCGTLCSLTGNNRGQALLTCFASAVRCMMACIALFFGLAVTGTALLFMLGGV